MFLRFAAAFLLCLVATSPADAGPSPALIPAVKTTSLAGETVELPGSLEGKVGVLVVGFSKASGERVTAWGKRLSADYGSSQSVTFYEMAMLADVPRLVRGMVVRSMRGSMPEPEQTRFLPLMEDAAAWRSVAHYDKPDDSYVMVVDGRGQVLWQTEGEPTDAAYAGLRQQVEQRLAKTLEAR